MISTISKQLVKDVFTNNKISTIYKVGCIVNSYYYELGNSLTSIEYFDNKNDSNYGEIHKIYTHNYSLYKNNEQDSSTYVNVIERIQNTVPYNNTILEHVVNVYTLSYSNNKFIKTSTYDLVRHNQDTYNDFIEKIVLI
jgi:V8-like Glu-specific endopeptidase